MPAPGEHKTVQARILRYAQDIGWTYVPRAEAERRRGFDTSATTQEERARGASLYFDDRDVDNLIEHFRDKDRRKELFKEYKEIEMLHEIISPDAFLRPCLDDFATLSAIYKVVQNAYARRVYVDREFQKKTNELIRAHVGAVMERPQHEFVAVDGSTIEAIRQRNGGDATKVVNLVRSIERIAEENSDDPFLVAMADRAKLVQDSVEDRQMGTAEALAELLAEIERNEQRKRDRAAKGMDALSYFVLEKLSAARVANAGTVTGRVRNAFEERPGWRRSEAELRELRKAVTFAVYAEEEDPDRVTEIVESLFEVLLRGAPE